MQIRALGNILTGAIILSGLLLTGSTALISGRIKDADSLWRTYQDQTSVKARSLDALLTELGYGGMIHKFKNYVLRRDDLLYKEVHLSGGAALAALRRYGQAGTSATEDQAVADISTVIHLYMDSTERIRELAANSTDARSIDAAIRIEDTPAIDGVRFLMSVIDGAHLSTSSETTRTELLSQIRLALGYGGMIHSFKNYVLRQDSKHLEIVMKDAEIALRAISDFRRLGVTDKENAALEAIDGIVRDYRSNLKAATRLYESNSTPEIVDAVVQVDDKSALDGLNYLEKSITAANTQGRIRLSGDQATVQRLALLSLLVALGSSAAISLATYWVVVSRITRPLTRAIEVTRALSEGDTSIRFQYDSNDDIGILARVLDHFRRNTIRLRESEEKRAVEEEKARQALTEHLASTEAANRQLTAANERFRTVADNAPYPLGILSRATGYIHYTNSHIETLLGVKVGETYQLFSGRFDGGEGGEAFNELKQTFLQGKAIVDEEMLLCSPTIGDFWALVTIAPITYGDEDCYYVCLLDITDQKKYEQELIKAREMATQASQAKSEFLASMSHEIRTPMNGVLGTADLMLMSDLPDDTRENVTIIKESGDMLLALLNDILDLSKIEAGKIEIELAELDVVSLLGAVASLVEGQIEKKGLWLKQDVSHDLVSTWILADTTRVRQILTNLISNAIKFTDKGGLTLALSQKATYGGTVETRFEVTDTGIGMNREQQADIFEAFTQADKTITRKYGGTGLGLSICSQLAELMGGEIGLMSAPDEGSTFWFTVVTDRGTGQVTSDQENERLVIEDCSETRQPAARILVAEDNVTNQTVIGSMLDAFGFAFEVVSNGQEAVDAVSGREFDLVLMDINMPVLSGIEATRLIREVPGKTGKLPIVALTANAMLGDREKYLAAGMDDHVAKPINPAHLLQAIARLVRGTGTETVLDRAHTSVRRAKS